MKIKAHIPTQQYGFIEVSGSPEEKAEIERLYNEYAESPLAFRNGSRILLKAFVGGEIYFDQESHKYTDEAGNVYLSGSQYAKQFEKPFDKASISSKMAEKTGTKAADIEKMWELKSEISRDFGNSIHKALQLYEQYNGLATALEKTTHLHDHPTIKKAVESFYEAHKNEKAVSEALIVDHKKRYAGQIDRLLIVDDKKKTCRIQDYKTNADIKKSIDVYWQQLKFYAGIMIANGWTVEGLDIFWYDGNKWETFTLDSKENKPSEKQ